MVSDSERTKILEMIEDETITAEDGLSLLNALDAAGESGQYIDPGVHDGSEHQHISHGIDSMDSEEDEGPLPLTGDQTISGDEDEIVDQIEGDGEVIPTETAPPDNEELQKWKRWWVIPLWVGAGVTVIGGLLMYWAFRANGYGFWFACTWFPFLLGVVLLAFAWNSRTAPWIHVRVHQAPGKNPKKIAISFPIPVRLTVWGLRIFGHYIPQLEGTSLDEVILALKDVAKDGTPLFIDVDDNEDGERVQVFIG